MNAVISEFVAIAPRHLKVLLDLWEQRKYDPDGSIGWRGLMDDDEQLTPEEIFNPLLERGLIEDLTRLHNNESGRYRVHITALGILCLNKGQMLREARKMHPHELEALEGGPLQQGQAG